jgi:hypothetical protein
MTEDRPGWARRITREREARGWSQAEAVRAMRAHASGELASDGSLLRQWKRWEAGEVMPGEFYRQIIAATFGTVTHSVFPVAPRRDADSELLAAAGMDTLELVSRLQRSDVDEATLNGLRVTADALALDYPHKPPEQLLIEGRAWLRRMSEYRGQRITLKQHREVLIQAAWVTLLVACVEYDLGNRQGAETTRQGALSLGEETDHAEIQGWAHEIRAWMNLTGGDYHGVIAAAQAGTDAAPHHGVAVQLAAQEAKAWSRIGDRRMTEVALDRGRRLLDAMPYPENIVTTSWLIRPSSTSTPWTATGNSPRTRWPGTSPGKCSGPVPTSTAPNAPPCATPKPGSPLASSPPVKATSNKRCTTVNEH